jgi:hypothetical protein
MSNADDFAKLLEYHMDHCNDPKFKNPIRTRLAQIEISELRTAIRAFVDGLNYNATDPLIRHTDHLIDYIHRVDLLFEAKKSQLLTYAMSLAGFCITYIGASIALTKNTVIPVIWGPVVTLACCMATFIIYLLTADPEYPHRSLGYSPYFYSYNLSQRLRPSKVLGLKTSGADQRILADKLFIMDLAAYTKRLKEILDSKNLLLGSTAEQIVMLFTITAHKSTSVRLMRNVLLLGLVAGVAVYLYNLCRVIFYP